MKKLGKNLGRFFFGAKRRAVLSCIVLGVLFVALWFFFFAGDTLPGSIEYQWTGLFEHEYTIKVIDMSMSPNQKKYKRSFKDDMAKEYFPYCLKVVKNPREMTITVTTWFPIKYWKELINKQAKYSGEIPYWDEMLAVDEKAKKTIPNMFELAFEHEGTGSRAGVGKIYMEKGHVKIGISPCEFPSKVAKRRVFLVNYEKGIFSLEEETSRLFDSDSFDWLQGPKLQGGMLREGAEEFSLKFNRATASVSV